MKSCNCVRNISIATWRSSMNLGVAGLITSDHLPCFLVVTFACNALFATQSLITNYLLYSNDDPSWHCELSVTRSSATAEEPRDALRQLKYCGCFLTELLTRSSANAEKPCEHTVSRNRVKCHTNVRQIAFENVCKRWMTFKVIQGHCRWYHLIGHTLFPISLPL